MSPQGADRVLGGRYQLIREIARGGMAAVWEARDDLLDRRVAVKLLHAQLADDPEFLERFRLEARAAAGLSHPNIVSIYDVGEDPQTRTPYIVMELVDGGNLKERIRAAAPLPNDEIGSIGMALASALAYAHTKGVIHRDVKPQNVLIGEDGRPRLADFGIAQAMATSNGLTRTGAVMGSVHYLAPELVRGRPATAASDVYGLGAVLYEMATGRVPFEGETDLAVALAHVEQTPADPRALNPRLGPHLQRTIVRALAKSPEQRFLSAADLAAELRSGMSAAVARRADRAAVEGPTQRIQTLSAPAARSSTSRTRVVPPVRPSSPAAAAPAAGGPRRVARPRQPRGASGGVLALLLALTAVLVALGAGFFGFANLNREVAPPDPTPSPTPRAVTPTAAPKPAVAPTTTSAPAPSATPEASATPQPSPSPLPSSPTSAPLSPTRLPPPSPTPPQRAIAIPQLRGKTLDDAQVVLKTQGFTATVRGVNVNVDKNVVVDQAPDVGTSAPPGTTVTIIVGTGSTAVPEVSTMPRDQALRTLQNSSFHVTARERRDPRILAGAAIETLPPAGTVLTRNSEVELTISSGR